MKKNKGFTLVELIAVVTLLAAIILISVPSIINTIKRSEDQEYKDFEKAIIRASELYVERNREKYPELNNIGSSIEIDTNILIDAEYLKQDLKDPNDNTSVTNYKVKVEVGNDQIFNYKVMKK